MNITQINTAILQGTFTNTQLNSIIDAVKFARSRLAQQTKRELMLGDNVSFTSTKIPHTGPEREVINEQITVLDRTFTYCSATIGNPHCVLPLPEITSELAHKYGPHLETHANFPRKTNVQFLQVIDRANIRIEIWERGAGYTLASGSSSSAAAAVAHKLGLVDGDVTVHMPGGQIGIIISPDFAIRMTGTVNKVAEGAMHAELFKVKV